MGYRYLSIKNGELEGKCLPSAAAVWERHGWTVVDDGSSETDSPETAVQPSNVRVVRPDRNDKE